MRFVGLFFLFTLLFFLPAKDASAYQADTQQEFQSFDEDIVYKSRHKRRPDSKSQKAATKRGNARIK